MKLLIISNMPHHLRDGQVVGWGPTVQEIDHLAELFTEVRHVACLHTGPAPQNALPYSATGVSLVPVQPVGGERLRDKAAILARFPSYARVILSELPKADVVHVRCTANISMLAVILLAFRRHPQRRWIKFATNWQPDGKEAWSSTLQRWWLRKGFARGWVTINGDYPGEPPHVRPFLNPCLTDWELEQARQLSLQKRTLDPLRLLFVGSLDANKGVLRALEIIGLIRSSGVNTRFEVVGDGPERQVLELQIAERGLADCVTVHGWLPRTSLGPVYARSHLFLLTSRSEGWPKVLSEAMAYGVVPIASAISCIPNYLRNFKVGRPVAWNDLEGFARAAMGYCQAPGTWQIESTRAMDAAGIFSYSNYLSRVGELLNLPPTH